ncbi:MAG: Holliday junction resolvase RuvX, partial [Bacteroidetes bacterium]|nr:Holliday junction resolvase RuvX [Bacteroidota bacterium]
ALSDELGIIASGIGTLGHDETLLPRLLEIIRDRDVVRVIIGLPLTLKAEQGASALNVQGFVPRLEAACGLPVEMIDERFTSSLATQAIRDMGVGRKKRREKGKVDEIAAIILLQGFLDSRQPT